MVCPPLLLGGQGGGDVTLKKFFARGWEEVGMLGIGARGQVLSVRQRGAGSFAVCSALKRSAADEVRALEQLSQCRNIVELQEHFAGPGRDDVWVRLELLEGGSLRGYCRSVSGKVPKAEAKFICREVLIGLQDIHRKGWMHRDVKAENVGFSSRVGGNYRVKLMDFDMAVRIPCYGSLHEIIGTVENMAPEVFAGAYNERADNWSLGVVAYELLFGYRPFNDASIDQVEEMVRNWKQYLVISSDASEGESSFLKSLLIGAEDRLSSEQAARHPWLSEGYNRGGFSLRPPPSSGDYSEHVSSARATKSGAPSTDASEASRSAFSPTARSRWQRRRTHCGPVDLGLKTIPKTSEANDLGSLSRIRESLFEWKRANFGEEGDVLEKPWRSVDQRSPSSMVPALSSRSDRYERSNHHEVERETQEHYDEATECTVESNTKEVEVEVYYDHLKSFRSRTQELMRAAVCEARRPSQLPTTSPKSPARNDRNEPSPYREPVSTPNSHEARRQMSPPRKEVGGPTEESCNGQVEDFYDHLQRVRSRALELVKAAETETSRTRKSESVERLGSAATRRPEPTMAGQEESGTSPPQSSRQASARGGYAGTEASGPQRNTPEFHDNYSPRPTSQARAETSVSRDSPSSPGNSPRAWLALQRDHTDNLLEQLRRQSEKLAQWNKLQNTSFSTASVIVSQAGGSSGFDTGAKGFATDCGSGIEQNTSSITGSSIASDTGIGVAVFAEQSRSNRRWAEAGVSNTKAQLDQRTKMAMSRSNGRSASPPRDTSESAGEWLVSQRLYTKNLLGKFQAEVQARSSGHTLTDAARRR